MLGWIVGHGQILKWPLSFLYKPVFFQTLHQPHLEWI